MLAIPKYDVQRIQSAQVITSLAHAAKELLENAIDAHATKISIKFVNHGLDLLEVTDNGAGIRAADYATLATPHATSKLKDFDDLEELATLGFRGEALGALCSLSSFSVTTCTAETYPMGALLSYDHSGTLESVKFVSAQIGSIIRIADLFSTLPVRRKDLEKNAKRELAKAVKLLSAYAAVQEGIKMEVVHISDAKATKRISCLGAQGTSGSGDASKTMVEIFGSKLATTLIPLDLTCAVQASYRRALSETGRPRGEKTMLCRGFVSKPWSEYTGMADRQLVSINKRPCSLPAITKLVSSLYQGAGGHKQPFLLLDLTLPPDTYDINVSPDKRTIFLHDQDAILDSLREHLLDLFSDDRRVLPGAIMATPQLSRPASATERSSDVLQPMSQPQDSLMASSTILDEGSEEGAEEAPALTPINIKAFSLHAPQEARMPSALKRKRQDTDLRPTRASIGGLHQSALPFKPSTARMPSWAEQHRPPDDTDMADEQSSSSPEDDNGPAHATANRVAAADTSEFSADDNGSAESEEASAGEAEQPQLANGVRPLQRFTARLKLFENSSPSLHLHQLTSSCDISPAQSAFAFPPTARRHASMRRQVAQAGLDVPAEAAEVSLSLSVAKTDFFGMRIVGQFNLGFIITECKGELFIIDQHASDEKSSYERLRRETQMATQRLAVPKELSLSSSQRLVLADSLQVLRKNGFEVSEDEEGGRDGLTQQRYHLTSVPQSKNVSFDVSDLVEILDRIAEQSPSTTSDESQLIRCRKAERMFASRACRSSIMIGTALTRERMQSVVFHMGELQKPWNCPHGRPTMRHLANIETTMTGFRGDYD
jgi:DNA mismatch repair protein PMS2